MPGTKPFLSHSLGYGARRKSSTKLPHIMPAREADGDDPARGRHRLELGDLLVVLVDVLDGVALLLHPGHQRLVHVLLDVVLGARDPCRPGKRWHRPCPSSAPRRDRTWPRPPHRGPCPACDRVSPGCRTCRRRRSWPAPRSRRPRCSRPGRTRGLRLGRLEVHERARVGGVGLHLDVRRRLVERAHRSGEGLPRALPVLLVGVVGADGEGDLRRLGGVRVGVVAGVLLHVGDGMIFLAEAEAQDDGVARAPCPRPCGAGSPWRSARTSPRPGRRRRWPASCRRS